MRPRTLSRTLTLMLLTSALAFSGCVSDEDTPTDKDASTATGADEPKTGGLPGIGTDNLTVAIPGTDACATTVNEGIVSWSHDATQVPAAAGESPFELAAGAAKLIIEGSAKDYVAPDWSVTVTDPAGTAIFSMGGTGADAASATGPVTGEGGTFVMEEILQPAKGTYTVSWDITGYVDGLVISASADMCRAA